MNDAEQQVWNEHVSIMKNNARIIGFLGGAATFVILTLLFAGVQACKREPTFREVASQEQFYLMPPGPFEIGPGERLYLLSPEVILNAIRDAEGAPSYGVMVLAKRYNGHQNVPPSVGREAAAKLVHKTYRRWRAAGRPGDFLAYLHRVYAPRGASNDPNDLNAYWLRNVNRHLASSRSAKARR